VSVSRDRWLRERPVYDSHDGGRCKVLRDDLLEGGSKLRFLPYLVPDDGEIVFGGPCVGGAPLALSVLGREQQRPVTLFYAQRQELHPRQKAAQRNGARIVQVPAGRMSVVQSRAREYAASAGAAFLPLGFDLPAAEEPFEEFLRGVRLKLGSPDQVWCAAGSGMLARCLGRAFPESAVKAVAVGLASRHSAQAFGPNVELLECEYRFEQQARERAPFSACLHYEAKAWERCVQESKGSVLFYNVMGEAA